MDIKFVIKKTVILTVICLLPMLSIAQVYFSQVIEGFSFIGPKNVEESVAVSQSYFTYLQTTGESLREMQVQNEVVVSELKNRKRLKRRDKRQIKDVETKNELIDKELLIIRNFEQLWWTYHNNNRQPLELFNHLQNEQCAIILTSMDTLFVDDYEVRINEVDTVMELIPIKVFKKQFWKQLERDGKEIWCLIEKESYLINAYGGEIETDECPVDFTFSNDKQYCQRKSPLSFSKKPLSIRIFNKKTDNEVLIKSWQASDCQ